MKNETYQHTPERHGRGMFFFTDCGAEIYSVKNDPMLYHGKLCPKCLCNGEQTTLYIRGSEEAKELMANGYEPPMWNREEE